jgi:hypothetical protein
VRIRPSETVMKQKLLVELNNLTIHEITLDSVKLQVEVEASAEVINTLIPVWQDLLGKLSESLKAAAASVGE